MYGNGYNQIMMPRNYMYFPYSMRPNFYGNGMNGLFRGIKNINWQGLLNNASRTLGVVREAIPVVKEVGPMINNMRSMIKIASVFKDETDTKKNNVSDNSSTDIKNSNAESTTTNNQGSPNFFL